MFLRRKYAFDRCLGGVLLVLTSPLVLVLIFLVKLTSPGPGLYRQTRVGLNGKTFEIIKLRSMVKNAEKPGQPVWCVRHDSRVTWLGKILRKLHLDELPQLWNVASGEMSLVGPRPERPEICESLAEQIDNYYHRNTVKPGVTGLAQVNLPPDETIDDVRRKQILDLRYIEEASWWLDLRMMAATALRMVGVKGEVVMKMMGLCRRDVLRERLDSTDCFDGVCYDGGDDSHWSESKADRELVYAATSKRISLHPDSPPRRRPK
ncbi:sugar transferase [Novipirellula sp.]|uniref:sugar transferase n=1 Tax=Novipirellula sp. TaxID=2795430 RepID=UPI00356182BC